MINKIKKISDSKKVLILRWWCAGAVFFMVGMGMPSIGYTSFLDVIFSLAIGIVIVNLLIVEPVVYYMFKVEDYAFYQDQSLPTKAKRRIGTILGSFIIVFFIIYTYQVINTAIISIFNMPTNSVPMPAEPFLFATFYVVYFTLFKKVKEFIKRKLNSR